MLIRSHCSLVCLLRTACFARALCCAHSLARSLPRSWESEFLMSQNDIVLSHSAVFCLLSYFIPFSLLCSFSWFHIFYQESIIIKFVGEEMLLPHPYSVFPSPTSPHLARAPLPRVFQPTTTPPAQPQPNPRPSLSLFLLSPLSQFVRQIVFLVISPLD